MLPLHGCKAVLWSSLLVIAGCNGDGGLRNEQPDPILVEDPVAYIIRSSDGGAPQVDPRNPAHFNPGAQLWLQQSAAADANSRPLTQSLFDANAQIDVADLAISDDGQTLLFSLRAPQPEDQQQPQPSWNIWRYQRAEQRLSRVISSDNSAERGNDRMAQWLPDGRIVFASDRQQQSRAILLDEGKPQYQALDEQRRHATFNLHVMEADGSNIEQLTFNLSHDTHPLVQQDGTILYSRWDNMGGNRGINLYQINPDGSDNQLRFGWHSRQISLDGQTIDLDLVKPQQLPNGDIYLQLQGSDPAALHKRPLLVNISDYLDLEQSISPSGSSRPSSASLALADFQFTLGDAINPDGRLANLWPLVDGSDRYLLSWDLCRVVVDGAVRSCGQLSASQLQADNVSLAPAQYELWLLNRANGTQQRARRVNDQQLITEALVLQASANPKSYIAPKRLGVELDAPLAAAQTGVLNIRSVYDIGGIDSSISPDYPNGIVDLADPKQTPASARPARFLRILRGVPMPPEAVRQLPASDFGRSQNQLMREIVGYTPIQPDGSVQVQIPANVPLALSVVDGSGQRLHGRHHNWLTVSPGETLSCNGCHSANNTLGHGRFDAEPASINLGAIGGMPFRNSNPDIIPSAGQTMAEALGIAQLQASLHYQDRWTDVSARSANPELLLSYANLATPAPIGSDCFDQWHAYCRLQINYRDHIQPLWDLARPQLDRDGLPVADHRCSSCHSSIDADGQAQLPAGQLDLSAAASAEQPAHPISYRELLFNDVEQQLVDGVLLDRLIEVTDADGNPVYQTDADGELILDDDGNPIPLLTTVEVTAAMQVNGGRASNRFFNAVNDASHPQQLSADEQRLISEWLDIGGQFYNTPFYSDD
ncbi:PD40 domain-containing protein [Ferrimonas senticii]|uniref:HzsA-related protein n=1 Tax=Ferrimonas senticii TaxID=394566 RepID=UPI0004009521|nr:PD40 domain-containing protein [Ferrimonas senticii]